MIEVAAVSIEKKRFVKDRGFLIGPYCPIYGCGVILITLLLQKYADDPVAKIDPAVMNVIIYSVIEKRQWNRRVKPGESLKAGGIDL